MIKMFIIISFLSVNLLSAEDPRALIRNSIEEQQEFENLTELIELRQKGRKSTYHPSYRTLSKYFSDYQMSEYIRVNSNLRSVFNKGKDLLESLEDPLLEYHLPEYPGVFEMLTYILVLPKTSNPSIVYRGIVGYSEDPGKAIAFSRFERPGTFLSTSLNLGVAKSFAGETGDMFVISLPRGFPFFLAPSERNEEEIILPPYVLNKSGMLAPIELEIRNRWNYVQSQHHADISNAMEWNPEQESLLNYQKRYAQKVCDQMRHINAHTDVICSKAEEYYKQRCLQSATCH